jgi:hypothetical protein
LKYGGGSGNDGSFTDGDTGAYEGAGCDPGVCLDLDWAMDQGEVRAVDVVARRAQESELRDCRVSPNVDASDRVAFDIVRHAAVWGHMEIPWRPNPAARVRSCTALDGRAKYTQEKPPPPMQGYRRRPEKYQPHDVPELSGKAITNRQVVLVYVIRLSLHFATWHRSE